MTPKRVAVIGAGASGLTAIKSCLDEGLVPVCFERTDDLGGLWRYTDEPIEGQGCVMKSTVINTSKEMMSYSDFPIPAKYPIFMHNTQVQEYFRLYSDNFNLQKYIQFNVEVVSVKRSPGFSTTGRWEVVHRDKLSQQTRSEVFDGVLVCTGHHADKNMPSFPGLEKFKGKVVHSHDYRKADGLEGKRVIVIGIGNSGGDIAVELSRIAAQVFLSTRRGTWILNRISNKGYPFDMETMSRQWIKIFKKIPKVAEYLQIRRLNRKIDHDLYRLRPSYGPSNQHPLVNDDMPNRIICGSIKVKANVQQFSSTGAQFVDGTFEDNIDLVILATGYTFGFPFIEKEVIDVQENRVELFKYMYPPALEHHTLAIIGCFQPRGAIMPLSEMQCRLATRVIKGEKTLPSRQEMWNDIRAKESALSKRYVKSQRHTIQVDYIQFMDELAELVGCSVDYFDLLKKDLKLALKVIFGPVTSYTYRLYGPGQWAGARDAILNQWNRTVAPLDTRPLPPVKRGLIESYYSMIVIFVIACFVFNIIL